MPEIKYVRVNSSAHLPFSIFATAELERENSRIANGIRFEGDEALAI